MTDLSPDMTVIQALRSDVALQLARYVQGMGITQNEAAKRLSLPQPTLSKILNGRVSDVSLELLIRVAARASLPLTLQTGRVPQEAGAFVSRIPHSRPARPSRSRLAEEVRESLNQSERRLTPAERLQAFVEHNEHLATLHQAGRLAEAQRARKALRES